MFLELRKKTVRALANLVHTICEWVMKTRLPWRAG